MTAAAAALASYRSAFAGAETVSIRRYEGLGNDRSPSDYGPISARVTGFMPDELVGNLIQGDRKVIFLAADIIDTALPLPIVIGDRLLVDGKELSIQAIDDSTRRVQGVTVAYEMVVRG